MKRFIPTFVLTVAMTLSGVTARAEDPESIGLPPSEPESVENKAAEPKSLEPKVLEPTTVEAKAASPTATAPVHDRTGFAPEVVQALADGPAGMGLRPAASNPLPWVVAAGLLVACAILALYARRRGVSFEEDEILKTIASRALTPDTKLVLLEVRDREFLLTVGAKGTSLIAELLKDDLSLPVLPEVIPLTNRIEPPLEAPRILHPRETSSVAPVAELYHSQSVAGLIKLRTKVDEPSADASQDAKDSEDSKVAKAPARKRTRAKPRTVKSAVENEQLTAFEEEMPRGMKA